MNEPVKCQRCPTMMIFVQMVKKDGTLGKTAPIEATPSPNGNVRLVTTATGEMQGRVLTGADLSWSREENQPLHMNHFGVCVHAASFRKPK